MEKYVITISRQFASMGRSIAKKLAEDLSINFYDRDLVEKTAKRMGQPISVISNAEENDKSKFWRRQYPLGMGMANMQDEIFAVQSNIIRDLAAKESCIIVGRCANYVLRDMQRVLNIYIYAPYEKRLENCTKLLGMDERTARSMIRQVDLARTKYRRHYCREADSVLDFQDVLIDSGRFGIDKTAQIIKELVTHI